MKILRITLKRKLKKKKKKKQGLELELPTSEKRFDLT